MTTLRGKRTFYAVNVSLGIFLLLMILIGSFTDFKEIKNAALPVAGGIAAIVGVFMGANTVKSISYNMKVEKDGSD